MLRKIIVIDNSFVLRKSLKQLLNDVPKTHVVADFSGEIDLVSFLKQNSVDVIFIDLILKKQRGTEIIKQVKQVFPKIKIIVFSINDQQIIKDKVLANGADGFISKISFTKQEIISELHRVMELKCSNE